MSAEDVIEGEQSIEEFFSADEAGQKTRTKECPECGEQYVSQTGTCVNCGFTEEDEGGY